MKPLFFICLFHLTFLTYAQDTLDVEIGRIEPRVNEEFYYTVETTIFEDFNEKVFDSTYIAIGNMSTRPAKLLRHIQFKQEGQFTIPSYSFQYNGVTYITREKVINVLPALPYEEGVWIRKYIEEGHTYLIIEQQRFVPKNQNPRFVQSSYSTKDSEDRNLVVPFDYPEEGVEIKSIGGLYKMSEHEENNTGDQKLMFSHKKFEVILDRAVKKKFKLTKMHYLNTNNQMNIPKIVIE